jgi:hypothetical protein
MGISKVQGKKMSPEFVAGVSPCQDGGADHCNYITATLHLDNTSYLEGLTDALSEFKDFVSNIYFSKSNIQGDIS